MFVWNSNKSIKNNLLEINYSQLFKVILSRGMLREHECTHVEDIFQVPLFGHWGNPDTPVIIETKK